MNNIFTLILFNFVLLLILLNMKSCNMIQLGGENHEIDDFVNKTKDWCDDNMDKMKKWVNAHMMCKTMKKNDDAETEAMIQNEQNNDMMM